MKTGENRVVIFSILVLFLLVGCPAAQQRTDYVSDADFETGNVSVAYNQALVTYAAGSVQVTAESGWRSVEVGDYVVDKQSLKTGVGAYCELQFGERAVIRIEEHTEIFLGDIFLKPEELDIEIRVAVGTMLCKVEKLSGGDNFKVKTRTAVCGVRGTEFGVTVSDQNDTLLAVKEGKVAFLPAAADAARLADSFPDADPALVALVEEIGDFASIVGENQEAVITENTAQEAETRFKKVEMEFVRLARKKDSTAEDRAAFRTMIRETNNDVKNRVAPPKLISPERKEKLRFIDDMRIHAVPVVAERKPDEKNGRPLTTRRAEQLVRIGVKVEPADAEIFKGKRFVGRGRFQGLFKAGEKFELIIQKSGFETKTLAVEVSLAGEKFFNVKLDPVNKSKGDDDKDKKNGSPEKSPSKPDREKPDDGKPDRRDAATGLSDRDKPVVQIARPSERPFVGDLVVVGNYLYGADAGGTVFACDLKGRVLWRFGSANNPNDNSSPVFGDQRIFFSGRRELVILNAWSGQIEKRLPLDDTSNGMFGRSVFVAGDFVIVPTDKSVQVYDSTGGTMAREIMIPGGSRMTPTFFGGKLYIVNNLGLIQIIDPANGELDPAPIKTSTVEPVAVNISLFHSRGYFAGRRNTLACIDLAARQLLWERQIQAAGFAASNVAVNEIGVFVWAGKSLFGFSHDGVELWSRRDGVSAPPLAVPGRLIIARDDNTLQIFDATRGNVLKSLKLKSKVTARPATMERLIIVGTEAGELIVIDPEAM